MSNNSQLVDIANEVHKPVRRNYPRRKVLVAGIDDTWAADLVDMQAFKKKNDEYAYMLNVIDVFSRYAWSVPLKTKSTTNVLAGFKKIISESGRKPHKLWTDKGTEFVAKQMTNWYKQNKIIRYSTYSEHKSAFVERFNRTLKTLMWKRFTIEETTRWIDMLPELLYTYNNIKKHSSIGMTPAMASQKGREDKLLKSQYKDALKKPRRKPKFKIGDWVRVSKMKHVFRKGYLPNWSDETFRVVGVTHLYPYTYHIQDQQGDVIEGSFYEQELLKTQHHEVYQVERIVKHRTRNGVKEVLVKWVGYPHSENTWEPASNFITRIDDDSF